MMVIRSLRKGIALSFLLILLITLTAPIYADDLDNIVFTGIVRDSAGALVTSARISIKNLSTTIERNTQTDNLGRYKLVVTEPGIYEIRVTASGFKQEELKEIEATSGRKINLDFSLAPSNISEQVQITESASPLIDTSRTVVGDTITRRELDGLPILTATRCNLSF